MEFFVYILKCADGTLYTGSTNNLRKRIKEHNFSKNGAHYTKIRRPVELVYKESYQTLIEARGREAIIKSLPRSKKEELFWHKKTRAKRVFL